MRNKIYLAICLAFSILVLASGSCTAPPDGLNSQHQIESSTSKKMSSNFLKSGDYLQGLTSGSANSLAFDKDNILWIALDYAGIAAYCNESYCVFDRFNTQIPDNRITKVFVDNANTKWFGTSQGFVYSFNNIEWKILPTPEGTKSISNILQDNNNTIWVSAGEGGVWSYKEQQVDRYSPNLSGNEVRSLTINSEGQLLV